AAGSADEVVMVVANPVLVASRRPGGLDAPEEALLGENAEGVVHRLAGHGTELGPHDLVDVVRGAVWSAGHRPQHSHPLGRDLQTVLTEERIVVNRGLPGHGRSLTPILESVQICAHTRSSMVWDGAQRGGVSALDESRHHL